MNIFVLDECPEIAAEMHCDKHVVKMIVESGSMLSTAHRVLDGKCYIEKSKSGRNVKRYFLNNCRYDVLYKATHVNHPSNVWTRESLENYNWHYRLFVALCDQYTLRYNKTHLTERLLKTILKNPPKNIKSIGLTPFKLAINEPNCICDDPVKSYQTFYKTKEKRMKLNWTKVKKPEWMMKK